MDYSKIYNDLIESAKLRPNLPLLNGYTEKHHIIPRSMGGSDSKDNIVSLTAREHFVAHWLLWRIHRNKEMACAFSMMANSKNNESYFSSKGYEIARKAFIKTQIGSKHTEQTRRKISLAHKGKKQKRHSEETKRKMSESHKGFVPSEENRRKTSESNKNRIWSEESRQKLREHNKGRVLSEETRRKISESKRKKKQGELPPCH